jgi:hypothetical protein
MEAKMNLPQNIIIGIGLWVILIVVFLLWLFHDTKPGGPFDDGWRAI